MSSCGECMLRFSLAAIVSLTPACESERHGGGTPASLQTLVLSEARLSIGEVGDREGHQLFRVVDAFRQQDGGIIVANGGTNEIRFYDANGDLARSVGGDGAGPGEFRLIRSAMRVAGDSIAVWDPGLNRLTILDPAGEVREIIRLAGGLEVQLGGRSVPAFPTEMHALQDGTVITELGFPTQVLTRGPDGTIRRDTFSLPVFDRTGHPVRWLGPFAGPEWYMKDRSSMLVPYGHRLMVATVGTEVFVGTGKGPIRVFTPASNERSIDVPFPEVRVSDDAFTAVKERLLSRTQGAGPGWKRMLAGLPKPDYRPRYDRLASSADGDLWVRQYREPTESTRRWVVLDPGGAARFQVEFDRDFELLDSGRDFVLVLVRDELDTEQILLYGLWPHGQ